MSMESHSHEHEFEPQYGLPERLPQGETILWQASPDVATLAREAFHLRALGFYFFVLVALRTGMEVSAGTDALGIVLALKWLLPLSLAALATVWALAWMTARTTVYTLTDKRLVMRLGIVLTVTFNLPFSRLVAADLSLHRDGFGDISVTLAGNDRIGWVHLWPSTRAWHVTRPQPTVRCVADAQALAGQLRAAWSASTGIPAGAALAAASVTAPRAPHAAPLQVSAA